MGLTMTQTSPLPEHLRSWTTPGLANRADRAFELPLLPRFRGMLRQTRCVFGNGVPMCRGKRLQPVQDLRRRCDPKTQALNGHACDEKPPIDIPERADGA